MSIYSFASDTTALSGARLNDTKDKLAQNLIAGGFSHVQVEPSSGEDMFSIHLLQGGSPLADVVPFFSHPLPVTVVNGGRRGKTELAVDVRNWGKFNVATQEFQVRSHAEYNWHIGRAALNQLWISEDPFRMRDLSRFPLLVYSTHLRESLTRRFMLDGAAQLTAQAIIAYFYLGLFTNEERFEEMALNRHIGVIASVTNLPASRVEEIVQDLPVIHSIVQLCEVLKERTQNPALVNLNVGTLVTTIAGNWSYTGREALAVSLEHPPTWLQILSACLKEASFKTTAMAKLVQKLDRKGAGEQFSKSLGHLYTIRERMV